MWYTYEGEIEKRKSVNGKTDYYSLYEKDALGNKPLTWNSVDEIKKSGWKKEICIRGKKGILRSLSRFNLSLEDTIKYIDELKEQGIPPEALTFNQSMPDEHLVIQGEIMRSRELYSLVYTTVQKPMNRAFDEETLHAERMKALYLLKTNFLPASYDDLNELFDIFPDSIIEFSTYDVCVGNRKNRNTIIWEVRTY